MKALSIRQPWAWLIVNGFKDIENRTWYTNYTGPVLIHAGASMTWPDFEACLLFIRSISDRLPKPVVLPHPDELRTQRGGIVGTAEIVRCVTRHQSPWFCGDYGFVFQKAKPLPFVPLKGALSFFNVPAGLVRKEAA